MDMIELKATVNFASFGSLLKRLAKVNVTLVILQGFHNTRTRQLLRPAIQLRPGAPPRRKRGTEWEVQVFSRAVQRNQKKAWMVKQISTRFLFQRLHFEGRVRSVLQ